MPTSPYRSPRGPKRFRVLTESMPAGLFHVCEGLEKPKRRAHWRLVASVESFDAAENVAVDKVLGRAILPADGVEVDFVNAAGEVLK